MGGLCTGGASANVIDPAKRKHAKQLLKQISSDANRLTNRNKMLLLGAGESGKSTIFKQMKILHANGYSEAERTQMKYIIHQNVKQYIRVLITQVNSFGYELDEENEDLADQVMLVDSESVSPEMAESIAAIWADPAIQKAYSRRAEYQLGGDGASYFLGDVHRVAAPGYVPTTQDTLMARFRTSGVIGKEFKIDSAQFTVWDVGGQRSERSQWLPLFDHVTVLVFVVAISEYDQVVAEDRSQNRVQEGLDLFTQIANSDHFTDADVLLFFNKKDLFEDKIKKVDPQKWFPAYKGGCNYDKAEAFFKDTFQSALKQDKYRERSLYTYTTCATDTKGMEATLKAVVAMSTDKAWQNTLA
jgi:GTPase SAR1 family protein